MQANNIDAAKISRMGEQHEASITVGQISTLKAPQLVGAVQREVHQVSCLFLCCLQPYLVIALYSSKEWTEQ